MVILFIVFLVISILIFNVGAGLALPNYDLYFAIL